MLVLWKPVMTAYQADASPSNPLCYEARAFACAAFARWPQSSHVAFGAEGFPHDKQRPSRRRLAVSRWRLVGSVGIILLDGIFEQPRRPFFIERSVFKFGHPIIHAVVHRVNVARVLKKKDAVVMDDVLAGSGQLGERDLLVIEQDVHRFHSGHFVSLSQSAGKSPFREHIVSNHAHIVQRLSLAHCKDVLPISASSSEHAPSAKGTSLGCARGKSSQP